MGDGPEAPHAVRLEHFREASGVGTRSPRISWTNAVPAQDSYEIELVGADSVRFTSGRIASESSVLVPWPAQPLASRERCRVRVRVWGGESDDPSPWSDGVTVEAGLLEPDDWEAVAAAPAPEPHRGRPRGATLLRREFGVRPGLERATVYATALGLYELELNGGRLGDEVLAPGWTSYGHRLRYQVRDVTSLLREGANALGAHLADGWYRGRIGFDGGRWDYYGDRTALLAQLEMRYLDGSVERVTTRDGWQWAPGPITATGLYEGERFDRCLEPDGWSTPGFDDSGWRAAEPLMVDATRLVAPEVPPIRPVETLGPTRIDEFGEGRWLVDFGQNISGRVRIHPRGPSGSVVSVRHAEVLEPDGSLAVRPLRSAEAHDVYIHDGRERGWWEPRFTIHGFRYCEVAGWNGRLDPEDIEAVVIHSDMARIGWFTCSDPMLSKLHENVVWSMRDNFVGLPTDCPQRDERLGWTGDIQVFAPTAAFIHDPTEVLRSWLRDLAAEQQDLGTVPVYVPWIDLEFPAAPVAAWGDAAVVVPWVLYERTGDEQVLREQYGSMRAWVDRVAQEAGPDQLWVSGFQLGDWLDPAAPPDRPAEARTDPFLVSAAYHARTSRLMARVAEALQERADAGRYRSLARSARGAFRREFVTPSGRLVSDTQTAYALALEFGLLEPGDECQRAGRRLVELVRSGDYRIQTGFVGTPLVCDALVRVGAVDDAYHLLLQRTCPSWLYPVTMGATTVWERWDSLLPDGSVNPGGMTSFNHYALGAVADFLQRVVGGLAPGAPGYRRLRVAPRPGGGLRSAATAHVTPFGRAEVAWERDGEVLTIRVVVPAGTDADVELPDGTPHLLGPGRHVLRGRLRAVEDDPEPPAPRGLFDLT